MNNGLTDACGIQSYDTNITTFTRADVNHPVTVTLTVTDIHGNSTSKESLVTVEEIIDPVIENSTGIEVLYPNPVKDELNIRIPQTENQDGNIEILSVKGKLIHNQMLNCKTPVYHLNVASLPKGHYLCRIIFGNKSETVKFIKQ